MRDHHPEHVQGMILRGVFLVVSRNRGFYEAGARFPWCICVLPEEWRNMLPKS